tara:strand:+ start:2552 stop:2749 length:198 start_codon:yes stop_codon:yes gene_type:complete
MRKFSKIEVIMTDNDGYLVLKALLPEGSILWARNVDKEVVVCLKDDIGMDYLEKNLNSLYRTFHM